MKAIPSFNELKKAVHNNSKEAPLRIALLGDSPTQLLAQAILGYFRLLGFNIELWEAGYNEIELQTGNPGSALYEFDADYVILFFSSETLLSKFYKTEMSQRKNFALSISESIQQIINKISLNSSAQIICYNYYELDDMVYGNYQAKTQNAFINQLRRLNVALCDIAENMPRLLIADVAGDYHRIGAEQAFAPNIYIQSGFVWSLDFMPLAAKRIVDIVKTQQGNFKKCLIIDLDDTIWGGTVGDDGWQNLQLGDLGIGKAYTEMQYWIKELKQRGVLICVCSKNDEDVAREVFLKHPDMILKPEDIAVFVANWNNKADNIRAIQDELQIGFDSMVFIDNSAFERNMVRSELSEVSVPELPEDPAAYLSYLRTLNLFETSGVTEEDIIRTRQYHEEFLRTESIKHYTDETSYLHSLNMKARIESFNTFNIPRIAQLTQRSNQFNLRTIRYTDTEIEAISQSEQHTGMAFSLSDKFGKYGLISVVILEKRESLIFIDTWLMSCRVLNRRVEHFVMNTIADAARKMGFEEIVAEYKPTAKNTLVSRLLAEMQFVHRGNFYHLNLKDFKTFDTAIIKE